MSRGQGKIRRAIEAVFAAEPDNALLLSELCERVYRRSRKRIEKKHRISVARRQKTLWRLPRSAVMGGSGGTKEWLLEYEPEHRARSSLRDAVPVAVSENP